MKKIVLFFCFFIFGCAVTPFVQGPIITGIIMWKQGEARKYYNEELLTIYHATKNSLKELNHKITKENATHHLFLDYFCITSSHNGLWSL